MHNDLIRRLRWEQKPGAESETTVLMSEAADALEAMQADAVLWRTRGEAMQADALRYNTVRRMNAQAFAEAYKLNIATGKPFDEIIDNLQPFYDAAMKQPARR